MSPPKTIVITSWYFNPIHPGHIECFELAKLLGDELWVIVNNDYQAKIKTANDEVFQDEEYRIKVVSALKYVDRVMLSVDVGPDQTKTAQPLCESIKKIHTLIKEKYGTTTQIIFAKWWDRTLSYDNIPEFAVCQELGITIKDGLWAKIDSSSVYRAKRI